MSELNTLKDMGVDACSLDSFSAVDTSELRKEAIKWIKEDIKKISKKNWMIIEWMKRFNITEDDLVEAGE